LSRLRFNKQSADPSAPAANKAEVYFRDDGKVKVIFEDGRVMSLSYDGMRDQNLLINGGFDYAQRQAPGTLTTYSQTAARVYGADQWSITNENASIQYRRVDTSGSPQTNLLARFYGEYSKLTATGKFEVSQPIEAGNCLHIRGRKVRLQMKLKASSAKTLRIALLQLTSAGTIDTIPGIAAGVPSGTFISAHGANGTDPTFGTNLSKIAPDTVDNATSANSGLTCSVTTSWQRFGGSFTLPSDFKNLVVVVFTDSQFAVADNFQISEAGLYDGVEIREWAERMQAGQLANCQRTCAKSFNVDTAPAQNIGVNTGEQKTKKVVAGATAGRFETIDLPVQMRAAPAITFYNPAAANAQARDETNNVDTTATTAVGITERQFAVTFTGNAATVAEGLIGVHWLAECPL
jgi:hypothetical protein